jgi:UDP-N-acetylglucosamine 2-epimerase (non-hydrolysing)
MHVLVVIGTRPEAIKLAPVVLALNQRPGVTVRVCLTGQHRELLMQGLQDFDVLVDYNLDLMQDRQTVNDVASRVIAAMPGVLDQERPDWVLVQGDTTTAMSAALAAFQHGVRVAHVEAGLRTGDITQPWPEEMNRRVIAQLARLHFAPTERARANLIREGIADTIIETCGNTVVDSLLLACRQLDRDISYSGPTAALLGRLDPARPLLLVTIHRRENLGSAALEQIEAALDRIAHDGTCQVVFPFHPNPSLADTARRLGQLHPDLFVVPPLNYVPFIALLRQARAVLTDSGGIQEEAAVLGTPVLIMREATERPEVLEGGTGRLVGTRTSVIVAAVQQIMSDPGHAERMATKLSVFGNGTAAQRICDRLLLEQSVS